MRRLQILLFTILLVSSAAVAQETPYFVTYDHHMEEVGDLEISTQSTIGFQRNDLPTYWAPLAELEYGVTDWWSSSLYLEGASQSHDSTVFTGFRLENRFKPLKSGHKINPVLYFEFEDVNEASRIRKEVVGHAEQSDEPLSVLRGEKAREIEGKLILSSNARGWNISENFIVEKNLSQSEATEFGYAVGVSRPLSTLASGNKCRLCRENFVAGLEMYGGVGDTARFGFKDTAQYIAPGLVWHMGGNSSLKVSPAFGVTENSDRMMLRLGYTYEIEDFGSKVKRMFGGK